MKNENKTQAYKVLRHLKIYGKIDPFTAISEYGIMRLSARIWNLREMGYTIETHTKQGINRFGEPCRWAEYVLKNNE